MFKHGGRQMKESDGSRLTREPVDFEYGRRIDLPGHRH